MNISTKDPEERIPIAFDFSAVGASVSSPVVSVAALRGTDPDAADLLDGPVSADGSRAVQWVVGGLIGVDYEFRCIGTTPNGTYVVTGILQVRRNQPDA